MRVFVCSPLRGDIEKNTENARRYCRWVVALGHRPFAPHIFYTQFLDDLSEDERILGISMGLEDLAQCDALWAFGPVISEGMQKEINAARLLSIPVSFHTV